MTGSGGGRGIKDGMGVAGEGGGGGGVGDVGEIGGGVETPGLEVREAGEIGSVMVLEFAGGAAGGDLMETVGAGDGGGSRGEAGMVNLTWERRWLEKGELGSGFLLRRWGWTPTLFRRLRLD